MPADVSFLWMPRMHLSRLSQCHLRTRLVLCTFGALVLTPHSWDDKCTSMKWTLFFSFCASRITFFLALHFNHFQRWQVFELLPFYVNFRIWNVHRLWHKNKFVPPVVFTRPAFEAHTGSTTFLPVEHSWPKSQLFWRAHALPVQFRSDLAVHRRFTCPLRRPYCTWSRHPSSRWHDWPVTQSIATPEPGCRDSHPRSSKSSQRPWGADGLVQGELPPTSPECWPFSPALPVPLGALLG